MIHDPQKFRQQARKDLKQRLTADVLVPSLPVLTSGQKRTLMTNPQEFRKWVDTLGASNLEQWLKRTEGQNATQV